MGDAADAMLDDLFRSFGTEGPVGRHRRAPMRVSCRQCGVENLRWQNVKGGKWRLHTPEGDLHVCHPTIERLRGFSHEV